MIFGLCDVNNFYVSCERSFNPILNNHPVIVLSNNDGCAVARSNEVKALGVKMGTPVHQIKDLIRQHDIKVFSSNYVLYADMSNRFRSIVNQYTPDVEEYSCDECFLGLDGFGHKNLIQYMHKMIRQLRVGVGLPVCVGLATSKTLSKIANHHAKSLQIPGSVLALFNDLQIKNALENLPVNEIWGVGRKHTEHLKKLGINTALQLRDADLKWIRKRFSVVMERTIMELRGESCIELNNMPEKKKQIVCTRSMANKTDDYQVLRQAVATHVDHACEKLRRQGSVAKYISVMLRTNGFSKNDRQYYPNLTLQLQYPSDDTRAFTQAAMLGLDRIYRSGYLFKKCGVMLSDISDKGVIQYDLFKPKPKRSDDLMATFDKINARFGTGTVKSASVGFDKPFAMRSNHTSPRFTSNWQDIIRTS
ncbi:Y-family DNA polymerase [Marinicella sp. W31]|uniref:Y-family DNA polymerase n=1 Tax=Marinicella sp. W31 TaxID=3023713 RepID=UPI003757E8F9